MIRSTYSIQNYSGMSYIDESDNEEIERLNTEKKFLQRKIRRLEKSVEKQNNNITDLNLLLGIERMKTRIFSHIIDQKTDISVSEILNEEKDSVHVYDIKGCSLPVYLHKDVKIIEEEVVEVSKRKEVFRSINCIDLSEEIDQGEIQAKVVIVDEEVNELVKSKFEPVNIKECYAEILSIFKKIKSTRTYTKELVYIKEIRYKMLGWLNIKEYQDLIHDHISKLSLIFKTKSYDQKKVNKIISDSLTPLEMRLTQYGKYYETNIDSEDIGILKLSLEVCTIFPKEYKRYKRRFKRFHNYNIVLFTVKKCIECYLFNRYGFHNLVYINIPNSANKDPYSYYYLEKINGEKRCWKMDCRLENITIAMCTELLPYCIDLYRKIYRDMFRDNNYRSDCEDIYSLAGNELEQLAENIIILHDQNKCRKILIDIVKEKAQLAPTDNDKIDIRTDDATQKNRFNDYIREYNCHDVPKLLFSDISKDDIQDFINKFKS